MGFSCQKQKGRVLENEIENMYNQDILGKNSNLCSKVQHWVYVFASRSLVFCKIFMWVCGFWCLLKPAKDFTARSPISFTILYYHANIHKCWMKCK